MGRFRNTISTPARRSVDKQHLMCVAPRQAIGGVNIQALDAPARGGVAKLLQTRSHKDGAAVALVHKGIRGFEPKAIGRDALAQGGELAGDRVLAGLSLAGNTGVNGRSSCAHNLLPDLLAISGAAGGRASSSFDRRVRRDVGVRRA
jgi:hypothetical protein